MDAYLDEVLAVVQELPGKAQRMWARAFREALPEVQGDRRRAAELAWQAFKGPDTRSREGVRAEKAMIIVAARGGTPEWIKLMDQAGGAWEDGRCPCVTDRRGIGAIVAHWEQGDGNLPIRLATHQTESLAGPVVGWIQEVQARADGLWIRVEWTQEGLRHLARQEFRYLTLELSLDESCRFRKLGRARLTDYPRLARGEECLGPPEDVAETQKMLAELGALLHLPGAVTLAEVKRAIGELGQGGAGRGLGKAQEERPGPAPRQVIDRTVAAAVAAGRLKPEQRAWAEAYAVRDWQGFNEFLELPAHARPVKKNLGERFFHFIRTWAGE